jgi:hypothetical protein
LFRGGIEIPYPGRFPLFAFLSYYYLSNKLGVYSEEDFKVLYGIYLDVTRKLNSAISTGKLNPEGVSGGFGYKEALLFMILRYLKP